jgi:FixJ family two-component response regulator
MPRHPAVTGVRHRQARYMATTKPLIAVVDDDPSIVKSIARALRLDGYEVATFGSGKELLGAVLTLRPRCLVLDVHMPKMNGFELQDQLAAEGISVPIIFVTAHDTPQTRARAQQTGTAGFLLKPFSPKALSKAIGEAMISHPLNKMAGGNQTRSLNGG